MKGTKADSATTAPGEGGTAHGDEPAAPRKFSAHSVQLLRTVQNNTLVLSQMADQKASILMGANFVVFSIAVSRSFTGEVPWSLAVLAFFAFLSSLLAVLAVLPSVKSSGDAARRNLLFFGHFTRLREEEWTEEMLHQLETDETVYRTMMRDIFQNGQVMQHRKYRFLAYAYRVFVMGLVATLATYAVEHSGMM